MCRLFISKNFETSLLTLLGVSLVLWRRKADNEHSNPLFYGPSPLNSQHLHFQFTISSLLKIFVRSRRDWEKKFQEGSRHKQSYKVILQHYFRKLSFLKNNLVDKFYDKKYLCSFFLSRGHKNLGRSCNRWGRGGELEVHMNLMPPRVAKIGFVRHVTGNDKDYLRKIPRVVW